MNQYSRATQEQLESNDGSARWLLGILIAVGVFFLVALVAGVTSLLSLQRTVPATQLVYSIQRSDSQPEFVTSEQMEVPLRRRMGELFGIGLEVNAVDDEQIEIILPTRDPTQIKIAKDLLVSAGVLRFLPIANPTRHASVFELVQQTTNAPTPQRDVQDQNGDVVGRWVTVGVEAEVTPSDQIAPLKVELNSPFVRNSRTGEVISLPEQILGQDSEGKIAQWIASQGIESIDVLAVVDRSQAVGGQDLSFAGATFDETGMPAVAFVFTDAGSKRMAALTTSNSPVGNRRTQLGVILDDQLLTAPNILSTIQREARITGNFTQSEVDSMVQILKAGQLPAKLNPTPVAESQTTMSYSLLDSFMQ
ncbi:Protein-export membrane protein SecD [Rhodopirellula islandica]|uniref:Protein-export membrane protein SecD n=1 Tax=Rhodopirellula islandica TaxID=595434 RepID=A0A0J1EI50_RHOIS|nr:hypothetical protein [Rhodopirellula islandica]KLU05219.1 Protein-export membrane protein SecD [Rhodopirellula islandica]